jgi:aerobic carbon-monoxide dehydrogenase medium subunit
MGAEGQRDGAEGKRSQQLIPRSFQYHAPKTVSDAISLLRKHKDEVKILAGGMSLIPLMKLRLASPTHVVDINRIGGLEYIKTAGNDIAIGSLTRYHMLQTSELVRQRAGLLAQTASWVGDPQVRNRGTVGGALVHCDPAGDMGSAILAMRGKMKIVGRRGNRIVKSDNFFVDTFTSTVRQDEILTEIRVPIPKPRSGEAYMKLERKAGDFATVGVAVQLTLDTREFCNYVGIGLTAVGPTNLRATKAESSLLGKKVDSERIEAAAQAAAEDARPSADPLRGSAEYKTEMTKVFTKRALELAVSKARKNGING